MAMESMRINYPTIQIRCTLTAHHLRFFAELLLAASARLHASLAQTPLLLVLIVPTSLPPTPTTPTQPTTTTVAANRTTATYQIQITTTTTTIKKQQPMQRKRKKRRERKTNRESDDVRTRSNGSSPARCPTAANPMAMKDPSRPI